MNFNDYQKEMKRTAKTDWDNASPLVLEVSDPLIMGLLGLSGETGEVLDYMKKVVFHKHDYSQDHMIEELGDVLWYLTYIADEMELSLDDIAVKNIEKLRKRYPDGFDPERSKNRKEESI